MPYANEVIHAKHQRIFICVENLRNNERMRDRLLKKAWGWALNRGFYYFDIPAGKRCVFILVYTVVCLDLHSCTHLSYPCWATLGYRDIDCFIGMGKDMTVTIATII